MKSVYEQEAVRKAHLVDDKSQREIAQELGLSRNTVSRLLETKAGENRRYRLKQAKPKPTLGQYESWIVGYFGSGLENGNRKGWKHHRKYRKRRHDLK